MDQTWLILLTIAFLVITGLLVYVLIQLRRAVNMIQPALEEFQQTMKSMRQITDDVNSLTSDVRIASGSVRDLIHNIRKISESMRDISGAAAIKVSGVRVGVRTAMEVLLKNLFLQKGGSE